MNLLEPFKLIAGIFYPQVCVNCNRWLVQGEENICLHCIDELPLTGFGIRNQNPVEKLFYGRLPVDFATSFLHFNDGGITQKILHHVKYRGNQDLAYRLGQMFGESLKSFSELKADLIIPVPLHPRKQRQRGYNQSEWIGLGLSEKLGIPVDPGILQRRIYNNTQTKKGRFDRWRNVGDIFALANGKEIQGKNVVLVDDVITTGATAEACLQILHKAHPASLGFLSLATA